MQRLFEGSIYLKFGRDFEDYIRAAVLTRGWLNIVLVPKYGTYLKARNWRRRSFE